MQLPDVGRRLTYKPAEPDYLVTMVPICSEAGWAKSGICWVPDWK